MAMQMARIGHGTWHAAGSGRAHALAAALASLAISACAGTGSGGGAGDSGGGGTAATGGDGGAGQAGAPTSSAGEAGAPASSAGQAGAPTSSAGDGGALTAIAGEAGAPASSAGEGGAPTAIAGGAGAPTSSAGQAGAPASSAGQAGAPTSSAGQAGAPNAITGGAASSAAGSSGSGGGGSVNGGSGGASAAGGTAGEAVCFGDWTLSDPVLFESSDDARAALIDDVDGDGRNDVALVFAEQVLVYLQAADGSLAAPQAYSTVVADVSSGHAAELGDLNGDGMPDLVVGSRNDVIWLPHGGQSGFLEPSRLNDESLTSGGMAYERLRLADIDGDGYLDATLLAMNDVDLATYYGDGQGGVRAVGYVMSLWPLADFAFTDVTGDGRLDAVGVSIVGDVLAFEQGSSGLSSEARTLAGVMGSFQHSVEVGDVDNDGEDDIIVSGGNPPENLALLRHQDGFSSVQWLESYNNPETTRIADLNGDSLEDVVVLHGSWMSVGVYVQCGSQLASEQLFEIPYATHYEHDALAIGDVNSDGCKDVAIADYATGLILLYGQNCAGQ